VAGWPAARGLVLAVGGGGRPRPDDGPVRLPGGRRADRHQVRTVLRRPLPGRPDRRGDRPRLALPGTGPPAGPRLPAAPPVHPRAEVAARLPPPGECPRQSPAAGGRGVGPPGAAGLPRLAVPLRPGARLSGHTAVGLCRRPVSSLAPPVRPPGAA